MTDKQYYISTSIIFAVIAIAHGARLVYELSATLGGITIPLWISAAAVLIASYLALRGFSASKKL